MKCNHCLWSARFLHHAVTRIRIVTTDRTRNDTGDCQSLLRSRRRYFVTGFFCSSSSCLAWCMERILRKEDIWELYLPNTECQAENIYMEDRGHEKKFPQERL